MPTNIDIMNNIRGTLGDDYASRIPQATQENITEVGNAILTNPALQNQFLSALFDKVALSRVASKMAVNWLATFKKGVLPYGRTIEDVFVGQAKAKQYDPSGRELFKIDKVPVRSTYHTEDRRLKYPVTVYEDELQKAFLSPEGLTHFVNVYINSMYSADYDDEYLMMKQLLVDYSVKGGTYKVHVDAPIDEATGKAFYQLVKQYAKRMKFMNSAFNRAKLRTRTEPGSMTLIIRSDVTSILDTQVLASAFNQGKVDFTIQTLEIDDFGSNTDTVAMLVSNDLIQWYDTKYKTTSHFNDDGLYWNYRLHHWAIGSISPFEQCVEFTLAEVTPGSEITYLPDYVDTGYPETPDGTTVINTDDSLEPKA